MESSVMSHQAGLLVDPGKSLTFTFDGKSISALAGQTIGAALYKAGVRIFSRSFKYHRPRGLFCVAGECANCLMQVDGRPNVRVCIEPAREGQVVRHQNAWPSLGFDVLRVIDKFDRRFPVGFYYKQFYKPRTWRLFESAARRIAGLGVIDVKAGPAIKAEVEHLHTEVCVVGGGPAGLSAAVEAAQAGASVLLMDRQSRLGGHLLFDGIELPEIEPLVVKLTNHPRARVLKNTVAFGLYEGNLLAAFHENRLLKIRAKQIIICTGGRERPFVFQNNDLPGILLARGVQRLARLYGVKAGGRAVVLTDHDEGARVAEELAGLGLQIAAVVDPRPVTEKSQVGKGWETLFSNIVLTAHGGPFLQGIRTAQVHVDGTLGQTTDLKCDLLCLASSLTPASELLVQGGVRFELNEDRWRPQQSVAGLSSAGAAAGTFELPAQVLEGQLRGAEAAAALGYTVKNLEIFRKDWTGFLAKPTTAPGATVMPHLNSDDRKRFVCLCEDVTDKDLDQAVAEGFDNIETLKRYSTAGMGACQGKACTSAFREVCARLTGRDLTEVNAPTTRPPCVPVELAVLAGSQHQPERRTPLHHWHQEAGARWLDAGQWKRPEYYVDPAAEVRLVRSAAGLIDVSTLGKIDVIGPDAGELLDRVYVNRFANLPGGKARYGVMCNEDGILFDDGVAARLNRDHFFLTATTGNADTVYQWLELWKTSWRLNATVINQTAALAAMNLAGGHAREILSRLTHLDLSARAFPYMSIWEDEVAGVRCRLLRVGFVGELGYEIHCPGQHAWYLWEAIMEAGRDFGLRPFGVEAQRILRLEKGHLIIGQDTDSLSTPLGAGPPNLVQFDKPDFLGKRPLEKLKQRGSPFRLVGFTILKGNRPPEEGCQVVDQGVPVGRVTSSKFSPTLGQCIGLAWLPVARSAVGERFMVRTNGADLPAIVSALPFYDPQGQRLKG
jgi:sarcosine oxidase subunit alpha